MSLIRKFALLAALALLIAAGLTGYTMLMARLAPGEPPDMAPPHEQADALHLDKSDRRLALLRDGKVIRLYEVSLGAEPQGAKRREGDERTPTGRYLIDWRNARSMAHLSLHISYPDAQDQARASAKGEDPGGLIMIHGLPNGWGWLGRLHLLWDWTDGCIAVTNPEMREIWALVPDGTVITLSD